MDIEAIDVVGGKLWICGSHCRVRRRVGKTGNNRVDARLRTAGCWAQQNWPSA